MPARLLHLGRRAIEGVDGPTDLDQLELRCRRHHRQIHGGRCRPPPYQLAA